VSSAEVTISIEPDHVVLTAGGPGFQFKAHVTGSPDTTVTWSIEEPPGGSSIDAAGVFKPPLGESVYHVTATSHSDPTKTATAVVNVVEDLIDHGGPVFPVSRTFALWWGDATAFAPDARTVLENMLRGLDGSAYLAIADQYMRSARATTSFAGNLFDSSVPPDDPTLASIADAACRALDADRITPRNGDLVLVLTSNFPSRIHSYCGWHSWTACHGQAILLAYIPNAAGTTCNNRNDLCNSGFSMPTISLLTTASHEFMEAITDPFASAWFGSSFPWDLADRCGNQVCVPLSTGTFELQDVYSNATHACAPR